MDEEKWAVCRAGSSSGSIDKQSGGGILQLHQTAYIEGECFMYGMWSCVVGPVQSSCTPKVDSLKRSCFVKDSCIKAAAFNKHRAKSVGLLHRRYYAIHLLSQKANTKPLFVTQNKAMRILYKVNAREHTNKLFIQSNILKVKDLVG